MGPVLVWGVSNEPHNSYWCEILMLCLIFALDFNRAKWVGMSSVFLLVNNLEF